MSYRLIDANALAMSCAEVNDLPCIYADLPNGLDGGHYDMIENNNTRWHELFGTPERAARTVTNVYVACEHENGHCDACPLNQPAEDCYFSCDYDALLEWLRGDAE